MSASRTIEAINVTIAPGALGNVSMKKYIDRLLTEYYEMPGIEVETEIDVNEGTESTYEGKLAGGEDTQAFHDELRGLAEKLLAAMQAGT